MASPLRICGNRSGRRVRPDEESRVAAFHQSCRHVADAQHVRSQDTCTTAEGVHVVALLVSARSHRTASRQRGWSISCQLHCGGRDSADRLPKLHKHVYEVLEGIDERQKMRMRRWRLADNRWSVRLSATPGAWALCRDSVNIAPSNSSYSATIMPQDGFYEH